MNKKKMKDPLSWVDGSAEEEGLNAAYIELSIISEDTDQPRKDYGTDEEREELRNSIKEQGVIQPITVYKKPLENGYYIIAGHRRFRACVELGTITRIPAVIKDVDFSDRENAKKEILLTQLEENLHRKNLSAIELANTYKIFQDEFNLSSREIAAKVQKSHHHVLEHLKLLSLPSELLNKVVEGAPLTKVLEASKLKGPEQRSVLDNLNGTSRDNIREKIKKQNKKPSKNKGNNGVERGVPEGKDYDKKTYSAVEDFNHGHNDIKVDLEKPSGNYELICKLSCRSVKNLDDVLIVLNKAFNNY